MPAKKAIPTKSAQLVPVLKFKKEWIFDPPPQFLNINQAAQLKIKQLKEEFIAKVNATIQAGQR
jgi:hypothetical protein